MRSISSRYQKRILAVLSPKKSTRPQKSIHTPVRTGDLSHVERSDASSVTAVSRWSSKKQNRDASS